MITDGKERYRRGQLPWIPGYEQKLYHPDNSAKDLGRDGIYYWCSPPRQVGYHMSSGVEIREIWSLTLGSRGDGLIQFEIQDRGKLTNFTFLSSVTSLLFSFPYFISSLDLGPVQMALAQISTTSGSQPNGGAVLLFTGSAEGSPWSVRIRCATCGFVWARTWQDG